MRVSTIHLSRRKANELVLSSASLLSQVATRLSFSSGRQSNYCFRKSFKVQSLRGAIYKTHSTKKSYIKLRRSVALIDETP
ncbi:MAG: hypothetical protein DMF69_01795 [Acidobacteria bacterium]|nr:MAG: hypothetical protein DMF69_01795 [Acidobacteriota bacterium]